MLQGFLSTPVRERPLAGTDHVATGSAKAWRETELSWTAVAYTRA